MSANILPERINRLDELAMNLWWTWHEDARKVFRALNYMLWRKTTHNPIRQLHDIGVETLNAASKDPAFLAIYDNAIAALDAECPRDSIYSTREQVLSNLVAYFSMEFAIHNSLPIYAGGLGVLSGDICKEASDMRIPLIGLGFMYPLGYFHQHISADGWQEEIYEQLDFKVAPIQQVISNNGSNVIAKVKIDHIDLALGAWLVLVGNTRVYLLDTNLDENPPEYRSLSARLYIADQTLRLQQEIILGIGGVRVLRNLNISPTIWHANEGHTSFMMLERIREKIVSGSPLREAVEQTQASTVFTTHTPVLAGHDSFSMEQVKRFLGSYLQSIDINPDELLKLGQVPNSSLPNFNMTAFALRLSEYRCGVSKLHGSVTRKMWNMLWPEIEEHNVPISSITNGVHVLAWLAPELAELFTLHFGNNWVQKQDDSLMWKQIFEINDEDFWSVHQLLKRKLLAAMREWARSRWIEDHVPPGHILALGALLDPDVLTIGFTRRFAEYKRPSLLFQDIERLKRIVNNTYRPVQFIFAGKSHPADISSKYLLQQVYRQARDINFHGHIAFVEDYNLHIARYLVQGVDVWLNTPRRLQEASGTSGMKAALNGVPNFSILDGWWAEAFNGHNGWSIGSKEKAMTTDEEDLVDAKDIYNILENEIVPLYYSRDRGGVPHKWIQTAKSAIYSVAPIFCARRMMKDYLEKYYRPIAMSQSDTIQPSN
jgi:starch phosphorylase